MQRMQQVLRLPRPEGRRTGIARLLALACVALSGTSCDGSAPLVSSVPAPALYFILTIDAKDTTIGDAYALAATAALPGDARYLSVESVTAYRVADGRSLAFEIVPRSGPVLVEQFGNAPQYATNTGNLRWRAAGDSEGLGVRDIQPGDSVVLRVVAEGTVLHGALRVPMQPVPQVSVENGNRIARWSSDAGTALWMAQVGVRGRMLREPVLDIDSAFTHFELQWADSIQVTAYDANSAAFVVPPFRDQAGVSGGLGVVGAVVRSRTVALPPKQ